MVSVDGVEITNGLNAIGQIPEADMGSAFGYTQLLGGYDGGQAEDVGAGPFANAQGHPKQNQNILPLMKRYCFLVIFCQPGILAQILLMFNQVMM